MSSPKPFGYYGLNLDVSTEFALDNLKLHELTDLTSDLIAHLNHKHYIDNEEIDHVIESDVKGASWDLFQQSDVDILGAIRGLCDRIELRLMEVAK